MGVPNNKTAQSKMGFRRQHEIEFKDHKAKLCTKGGRSRKTERYGLSI